MKTQSSLLKTINKTINFFWWLHVLFTIFTAFSIPFVPPFFEFNFCLKDNGVFNAANGENYPIEITDLRGIAGFTDDFQPMYSENIILFAVTLISLFIFYNFKKIVNSVTKNASFQWENYKRFRYIGFTFFALIILETIHFFTIRQQLSKLVQHDAIDVHLNFSIIDNFDWYAFFGGLFFLVLAELFKEGFSLKQETELTI